MKLRVVTTVSCEGLDEGDVPCVDVALVCHDCGQKVASGEDGDTVDVGHDCPAPICGDPWEGWVCQEKAGHDGDCHDGPATWRENR